MSPAARDGSLLVAGTASDAGKSVLTAGICRWLARQGVSVAPFKAQNMSNNSVVAADGAEIGRAQAMQAAACGIPAEAAMNPVLLKPGSDMTSQVVLMGQAAGNTTAAGYWRGGAGRKKLTAAVLAAYDDLRSRFDVVICEGAGSPAEINLRRGDLANMGLARARDLPVIVVGDIDRGGVFAALYGTLALLEPADQALISGFVVNKFRGDPSLLTSGLRELTARTGRPVLGVVPFLDRTWIDAEDAVVAHGPYGPGANEDENEARSGPSLQVAVIRLPRISNFTDIDALALEPGVRVRFVTTPAELTDADLVILPGTKATVADLGWLRASGLDRALALRAAFDRPLLGICGGYQMLGSFIDDDVESRSGKTDALGLLPVSTRFREAKTVRRTWGSAGAVPVSGYEIHHGQVSVFGGEPWFARPGGEAEGCRLGPVAGTLWHGIFEGDEFRRSYLAQVARQAGSDFVPDAGTCFAAARQAQFDTLADAVEASLDTGALLDLITRGPSAALPVVR